ncbi:MAG: sodium-dependent transporter [Bacteroidia bacterium]|nr:MAG: sodium-dependent transporter [Bacteroidia bacterium]
MDASGNGSSGGKRESFGSRFGVIAATAGSAVGLGNIWKFPYETGVNGGSAFLLIYLLFVFMLGVPVMVAEFTIGREGRSNAYGCFDRIAPNSPWRLVGIMCIVTAFMIITFYSTVAGWTLEYTFNAFTIAAKDFNAGAYFGDFIVHPWRPVMWQVIFLVITAVVILRGVTKGIERYSKILMPLLFLLILVICVRSLMLEGAFKGIEFLFKPDFSKINSDVILNAMGQAFFSLSLGMGAIITYGSYVKSNDNLVETSVQVSLADALVAVLAGIMIFPAVFAFGVEPAAGPSLVYITLPGIFANMAAGGFWSLLFFLLLTVAALTSMISLFEVTTIFFIDFFKLSRRNGTLVVTALAILVGIPVTLSMGVLSDVMIFGKSLFDLMDFCASNVFMPLGGLLMVLFVGWGPGRTMFYEQVTNGGTKNLGAFRALSFLLKFVVPILIVIIQVNMLFL